MGIAIRGWGAALPEKIVSNADLAARADLDVAEDWILERTGIRERRYGGTTVGLATEAAQGALEVAGVDASTVDLLLLATTTADQQIPSSASSVQHALGTSGGALDLNAACSGFVYALVAAAGMCDVGSQRVLVIGADVMSRVTDQDDRDTVILFGDGAGAVLVDRVDGPGALLGWDLGSDGSLRHVLECDLGSYMTMIGKEVFRQAVRVMVQSITAALDKAGVAASDVTLLVPHQANTRIIASACDKLGIPVDRTALVLERTGNTSSGSVPLALADAMDRGRVKDGDIVVLCGFGAGMTWATAVLRWGA
jgi:3-oxoacyl-[acyl-carrier-protein] synthase-3